MWKTRQSEIEMIEDINDNLVYNMDQNKKKRKFIMALKDLKLKPKKVIADSKGNAKEVILSIKDYRAVLRDLEELESIRAYDRAKSHNDETIPFDKACKEIEDNREL